MAEHNGAMNLIDRRTLLTGALATTALGIARPAIAQGALPRILVLGGGAGGAVAARTLKSILGAQAAVTAIIGADGKYHAPFLGTSVLLGEVVPPPVDQQKILTRTGIEVVLGDAVALNRDAKAVRVQAGGETFSVPYDLLVAAPGVSLRKYGRDKQDGDEQGALCWTDSAACVSQAGLIRSLRPGATLIFTAPPQPYRCPPTFYERACLTANFLKSTNPTAKILIVDEKDQYPMQELFEAAYADHYDGMIEWVPRNFHGGIMAVDPAMKTVKTESEVFSGDFLQAVPPQTAALVLSRAALTNERGFCPVMAPSMRSALDESVYVIGDASDMIAMSKSAVSAVVQGRLAAHAIAKRLTGKTSDPDIAIADQCWTFVAPDDAITLGGTYHIDDGEFVATARHVSVSDDDVTTRRSNAQKAHAWPEQMLREVYGDAK